MDNLEELVEDTVLESKKQPFINDETFSILMFALSGVGSCIISVIGICTNIATITIFIKLGFKETINISLTALAITDFASLLCLLWMSLCNNPSFCNHVCEIIDLRQVQFIIGGMQRAYFTIVGGCITTLVAFERCLCVLKPLQVKLILTRGKLITIIVTIFVVILMIFVPICYTTGVGWVFNPALNRSIVSLTFKENTYELVSKSYTAITFVCVATYVVVFTCTAIIVWKLASQSAWRAAAGKESGQGNRKPESQSTNPQTDSKKGMSDRDKRATRTVTLIASMYIVCFFPGAVLILTMAFVPEFNKGMLYSNTYEVCWAAAYILEGICSSANIIIYARTSTKFKDAFLGVFGVFCCKTDHDNGFG